MEGHGLLNQLKSALLAKESQGLEISLIASQIEAILASHRSVVDRLAAEEGATAVSVTAAIAKELGRSRIGRLATSNASGESTTEEATPGNEALIKALQSQAFSDLVTAISAQDLETVSGKRKGR